MGPGSRTLERNVAAKSHEVDHLVRENDANVACSPASMHVIKLAISGTGCQDDSAVASGQDMPPAVHGAGPLPMDLQASTSHVQPTVAAWQASSQPNAPADQRSFPDPAGEQRTEELVCMPMLLPGHSITRNALLILILRQACCRGTLSCLFFCLKL